jgi:hypothetical protein
LSNKDFSHTFAIHGFNDDEQNTGAGLTVPEKAGSWKRLPTQSALTVWESLPGNRCGKYRQPDERPLCAWRTRVH